MKEVPQSPNSVNGSRNRFLHKLEPTFHFSNSAMKGATKWDLRSYKASEEKLNEERVPWQSHEHEKIRAIIDDVKSELNQESKNRQRMEIVNSKLVNELADAKLSAKRYIQDYKKERKARELIEEVCDELAKEISDDKVEVEALKRSSRRYVCKNVNADIVVDKHVRHGKTIIGLAWEMDFESFLDPTLALENRDTPEGLT
ncbi:hypothetical protein Tco_0717659 [Tanacetum coccineum]